MANTMANTWKRAASLLLLCVLLLTLCAPALAADTRMYALRDTAVLKSANSGASVIGRLRTGDIVQKMGALNTYTLVRFSGGYGYVLSKDLAFYIDGGDTGITDVGTSGTSSFGSDIQVITAQEYVANATVNVRSGPGTSYRIIGSLGKGDAATGAGSVGNWTRILYKGGTGYVSTAYLTYTPTFTLDAGAGGSLSGSYPGNIVYTTTKVDVYNKASEEGKVVATLYAGTRAVRQEISGGYSLVTAHNAEGYVRTGFLREINGTGANEYKARNRWMYAATEASAYYIPMEVGNYRMGYYDANEGVWAIGDNGYWTQALVNGHIVYIDNSKLSAKPSSGLEYGRAGIYAPGEKLTMLKDSETFEDARENPYTHPLQEKAFGKLKKGTEVTVMYCSGNYVCVMWEDTAKKTKAEDSDFPTNLHVAYIYSDSFG